MALMSFKKKKKKFKRFFRSGMVDEKIGGVTPYNETEAYAEVGHYGATVVSPGFRALMAHLHAREFGTFIFNS
jgi:hypothetical protein